MVSLNYEGFCLLFTQLCFTNNAFIFVNYTLFRITDISTFRVYNREKRKKNADYRVGKSYTSWRTQTARFWPKNLRRIRAARNWVGTLLNTCPRRYLVYDNCRQRNDPRRSRGAFTYGKEKIKNTPKMHLPNIISSEYQKQWNWFYRVYEYSVLWRWKFLITATRYLESWS